MTPLEQVQQLFAELGPAADEIATVAQEPDGQAWVIELEDETIVNVEFEPQLERLMFVIGLPKPPADRRSETYEALLTFNLLWQHATPLRMAMDQPDGEILQVAEIGTAGLDVAGVRQALTATVEAAQLWRAAIAQGCTLPVALPETQDFSGLAIRV